MMGGLVGGALAGPLLAFHALGDALVGLPFVPYDLFDLAVRLLPGRVLTFAVETLVSLLTAAGADRADTAKTAEHLVALAGFGGLATLTAAASYRVWAWGHGRPAVPRGTLMGAMLGVTSAAATLLVNQTAATGPFLNVLWILGTCISWGRMVGWAHERLYAYGGPAGERTAVATPAEATAQSGMPPAATPTRPAVPPEVETVSRRRFLVRLGGAAAAITVVGAGLSRTLATTEEAGTSSPPSTAVPLPNAADPLKPAPGTRPEYTPLAEHYRIDIVSRAPRIAAGNWTLPITGLVGKPLVLTLADLRSRYPSRDQFVTLSCISNPVGGPLIGTTLWTGASLRDVLADTAILPGATHVQVTSVDGFYEVIDLDLIRADERIMLTYAWNHAPLPAEHGYPLRVFVPDRYGMKQPKWIVGLEVTGQPRPGYWVERGWDPEARVRATAVIDTVAVNDVYRDGSATLVPVGGIAYAGARGISRVEIQVDDGPWQQARLRAPLAPTTWVVWRFDWPFRSGRHTFTVRCFEGDGAPQVAEPRGTQPSGATGLHNTTVAL